MPKKFLITGGAGFIGTNYVARLLKRGESVTIYDNLSRVGSQTNIQWLNQAFGVDAYKLVKGDVRDVQLLRDEVKATDVIVHLAGQVAVTTSVSLPRDDFEQNALGTFNVLEAARFSGKFPIVLYASTNKVYGAMEHEPILEQETRYTFANLPMGVPETYPLDFHSPYGCSKGAGDQYTRDYFRIYGLPTVVLRQSCIYGPRQFGVEDQGWVAWFILAAFFKRPITINGNGKQVRDLLFIDDLLDMYDSAIEHIDFCAGRVYNIGGGQANTISIWKEFQPILEKMNGREVPVTWGDWRPGDQKVYVSDIRLAHQHLGWSPQVGVESGIQRLYDWVQSNAYLFNK